MLLTFAPRLPRASWLLLPLLALTAPAHAQAPGMPNLRAIAGRPLPVPELPPGTVTIRLARKLPSNPADGITVVAATKAENGDSRTRTGTTGADGRVTFEGLATGSEFVATTTLDGEKLETARFLIPEKGGTRVMLISGLPPPGADDGAGAADPHAPRGDRFRMGATTGVVAPTSDLPAGALEIFLKDAAGRAITGRVVRLGQVRLGGEEGGRQVEAFDATTDANGRARWDKLRTGEEVGYAAVSDHEGMRISTPPFRMPADNGVRGELLALARTQDPAVLSFDPRSKIVVDLREDALAVMVALVLRNGSKAIFDKGEDGLVMELPDGAVNTQEIEGGEPLEIMPGKGVRLKTPIPPDASAQTAIQMRFGYILPANGARTMDIRQVMPVAMPDPFLLVPSNSGLRIEATGLRQMQSDVDGRGEKIDTFTVPAVAGGATLNLTVTGIPGRDPTGRIVASVLSLGLLGLAIAFGRGPKSSSNGVSADSLVDKRETIFAELVEIERQRQAEGANPRLDERRRETVARLEAVYKDLARLE